MIYDDKTMSKYCDKNQSYVCIKVWPWYMSFTLTSYIDLDLVYNQLWSQYKVDKTKIKRDRNKYCMLQIFQFADMVFPSGIHQSASNTSTKYCILEDSYNLVYFPLLTTFQSKISNNMYIKLAIPGMILSIINPMKPPTKDAVPNRTRIIWSNSSEPESEV